MQPSIEEKLRKKYMYHPSKGMTPENIRSMSGEALLDMDYFLNDDDWTTISEKMDSISSNFRTVNLSCPHLFLSNVCSTNTHFFFHFEGHNFL